MGWAWGRGWAGESSRCEDPAPTVGVCGDALARRIAIPMLPLPPPPCAYQATHGEPRFYNRGGMGRAGTRGWVAFCRGLPFGIRRFKPILLFLGGRSDVACRIVVKTVGHGWEAHGGMGWGGGRGNLRAAKTPPLQSAFAGMPLRVALRSRCRHCRCLHAHTLPPASHPRLPVPVH